MESGTSNASEPQASMNQEEEVYSDGEKVLAYHGHGLYEARILKVEERADPVTGIEKTFYFLHYQGWNERWDEWVDTTRMLKYNDFNKKIQSDIAAEQKRLGKKHGQPQLRPPEQPPKNKKRKSADKSPQEEPKLLYLPLPFIIRMRLAEDQAQIAQKNLVKVPKTPNVGEILADFSSYLMEALQERKSEEYTSNNQNGSPTETPVLKPRTAEKIIDEIRMYFDEVLGSFLLYRFERKQFRQLSKAKKRASDNYGIEHLLRLLGKKLYVYAKDHDSDRLQVKLPYLVNEVTWKEEKGALVRSVIIELTRFLARSIADYPLEHITASPDYIKES